MSLLVIYLIGLALGVAFAAWVQDEDVVLWAVFWPIAFPIAVALGLVFGFYALMHKVIYKEWP